MAEFAYKLRNICRAISQTWKYFEPSTYNDLLNEKGKRDVIKCICPFAVFFQNSTFWNNQKVYILKLFFMYLNILIFFLFLHTIVVGLNSYDILF